MSIDYDHSRNPHTLDSPRHALPIVFRDRRPQSLLDVGCGTGTWLKAAHEFGIQDLRGVDGIRVGADQFEVSHDLFQQSDLTLPIDLNRKFDAVLCLEVGEHLDPNHASTLIASLARHADWILFSAACPGQPGQHHVNCQWPAYWQKRFNDQGFACSDEIRWRMWNVREIQPWYRQNIFSAERHPELAGTEERIDPVIHPDMLHLFVEEGCHAYNREIEIGRMPVEWYVTAPLTAALGKLRQRFRNGNSSDRSGAQPGS